VLFIGFSAIGVVPPEVLEKSDQVLPYLITHELGSSGLIYGLIGAGALAAAMSSADAITHGASVSLGRDVVTPLVPKITERAQLMIMRIGVVLVGTAAYYLAIFGNKGLIDLLLGAYGSIVQFAPAVYGALFWRRGSRMGAIAGLVVGVGVNFYFQLVADSRPFELHAGLLGLVANSIVFIVISLVTRVTPDHQAKADSFVEA
jgi:SSS family solute:Na+ symporter